MLRGRVSAAVCYRRVDVGRHAVSRAWLGSTIAHGTTAAAISASAAVAIASSTTISAAARAVVGRFIDANRSAVKPAAREYTGSRPQSQANLEQQRTTIKAHKKSGHRIYHTRRYSWRRWHSEHLLPGCIAQNQIRGYGQYRDPLPQPCGKCRIRGTFCAQQEGVVMCDGDFEEKR